MYALTYALTNTNNYAVHTATSLISAIHCFDNLPFRVYILHDETYDSSCDKLFNAIADKYKVEILKQYVEVDINIKIKTNKFSPSSVFRYLTPWIVCEDVAIYSDSDIIYQIPFTKLFKFISKKPSWLYALSLDAHRYRRFSVQNTNRVGIDCNKYFNSGFIVFNNCKIKQHNILIYDKIINLVRCNSFIFPDQDAFNLLLQKDCSLFPDNQSIDDSISVLPAKFNFNITSSIKSLDTISYLNNYNIHYCGCKPWDEPHVSSYFYWKYREILFQLVSNE